MNRRPFEDSSSPFDSVDACPECASECVRTRIELDRFTYGSGEDAVQLEAAVPVHKCESCGFEYLGEEAERAHHHAVCRHLGVLTPLEVVDMRQRHGLTRAEFARVTKLGEATLARWERGALIQNLANDNYLYLLAFRDNIQRLRNRSVVGSREPNLPVLAQMFPALSDPGEVDAIGRNFKLNKVA
jgi:DNA-binding transcriptional regulator YiaG